MRIWCRKISTVNVITDVTCKIELSVQGKGCNNLEKYHIVWFVVENQNLLTFFIIDVSMCHIFIWLE